MARLTRSKTDRILGGVCGGVAQHFGWDVTVVRLVVVAAVVFGTIGLWAYLIAWAVIPAPDGSSGVATAKHMWDEQKGKRDTRETFDPYRD